VAVAGIEVPIQVKRGVRQGDSFSPLLFTAVVEHVMRKLDWSKCGINIDGRHLTHQLFADDAVLISHKRTEIKRMLEELSEECKKVGLRINRKKTVVMGNCGQTPIKLDGEEIKYVDSFVYLGRQMSFVPGMRQEIGRRIGAGWSAFHRYKDFFRSRAITISLKRRLFNLCVLPAMLYASETWTATQTEWARMEVTQNRMDRAMLGITLRDRKPTEWIRGVTRTEHVYMASMRRKRNWARKIARMDGNRWPKRMNDWRPRKFKRGRGRPRTRWRDPFVKNFGVNWQRQVLDHPDDDFFV